MTTLDRITHACLACAKEHGILDLPETQLMLLDEEVVADFLKRQVNDLFEFQTLEQFKSDHNLFARASLYTYLKGVEFAFSQVIGKPLTRLGYDFDLCMQGKSSMNLPPHLSFQVQKYSSAIFEMFDEMFQLTKIGTEQGLREGVTYRDLMIKILNGIFFMGTKVGMSLTAEKELSLNFSNNTNDIPYDYDNYDQNYKVEDFKVVIVQLGDFEEIKHLFDEDQNDRT